MSYEITSLRNGADWAKVFYSNQGTKKMSKRVEHARLCQGGASNERKVAAVLLEAIEECRAEGVDPRTDDAVFLIFHQLAWLMSGDSPGTLERWQAAMDRLGISA